MANTTTQEAQVSDVKKTNCDECVGRDFPAGKVPQWDDPEWRAKGLFQECPWCQGTGQVDVLYDVRLHGHNGDHTFCELADVVDSLDKARKLAERTMKSDRFNHVLDDGTPTVRWVEIMGPGIEESLGLEEHDGQLVWSGEENLSEPTPPANRTATHEGRDELITEALGVAPGETLTIELPEQATHTQAFAEHVAKRDAAKAAKPAKVTWRKVAPDTGGGWSGLGSARPDVLARVLPKTADGYRYGVVVGGSFVGGPHFHGYAGNLNTAKVAAADALRRYLKDHNDAAPAAEGGTTMEATATLTAESMAGELDGIEAVRAGKAPYARFRANGKSLGYADDRKDGFMLNVAAKAIEAAPKTVAGALEVKGTRAVMRVTTKNAKKAEKVLAWLAKQVA